MMDIWANAKSVARVKIGLIVQKILFIINYTTIIARKQRTGNCRQSILKIAEELTTQINIRQEMQSSNAIRDGGLTKEPCEVCRTSKNVQAHHDDYYKMLEVRWLCFLHHRELHGQKVLGNDSS